MTAAARRAAPGAGEVGAGTIETEFLDGVDAAVDVVVIGLGVFALVAGAAGLLVLIQAVARQVGAEDGVDGTLAAVGLTRSQRAVAVSLPLVGAAVPGAVLGVIGAVAVSPLFPLGVASRAEPDPGLRVDPLLLVAGAVALVVLVGGVAFVVARRQAHRVDAPVRDSRLGGLTARTGAHPPIVVGVQLVDAPGRARVGVRTAMVGTAVALAGVCAVAVMATSLTATIEEPSRYGWAWSAKPDLDSDDPPATIAAIAEEEEVAAIAVLDEADVEVDGQAVQGYALEVMKGTMAFPVVEGRAPSSGSEIALGAGAVTEADLGDTVTLAGEPSEVELEVVGRVVLPQTDSVGAEAVARDAGRHRRTSRSTRRRTSCSPTPRTPTSPPSRPASRTRRSACPSPTTRDPTRRAACSTSTTSVASSWRWRGSSPCSASAACSTR